MKLNKPNFWDKKQITLISIILLPITIIYYLLFQLNKFIKSIFKKKFKNVKVICVGNIYLGGTGKTPLVIEIFKEIKKKNNVSVLKKNNHKYLDEINSPPPVNDLPVNVNSAGNKTLPSISYTFN